MREMMHTAKMQPLEYLSCTESLSSQPYCHLMPSDVPSSVSSLLNSTVNKISKEIWVLINACLDRK